MSPARESRREKKQNLQIHSIFAASEQELRQVDEKAENQSLIKMECQLATFPGSYIDSGAGIPRIVKPFFMTICVALHNERRELVKRMSSVTTRHS
jgi:hypothetical protein